MMQETPTLPDFAFPYDPEDVTELEETDVVMVGIGATGGIASYVLTEAGLKVVALEAGPRLGIAEFIAHYDELQSTYNWAWDSEPKYNKELPTWRQTPDEKAKTAPGSRAANMVGGTNVHYDSVSFRFREDDFRIRSSIVEKFGEEALPEGTNIADWAVTYEEMEPYYEKVEHLIGVSGKGGVNPFESPRKSDYPMPPLQPFGGAQFVAEGMEELGYHPYPVPSAINSEPYDGRPACTYCGYCGGHQCWNDSKNSTLVTSIPKAEETGNLEIRPNSRVFKVRTDDNGRASGVEYRGEDGKMYFQPAKLVILSAFMLENVRLLLLSANEQFPNGLANNTGQVGKYFMTHTRVVASGVFPGKNFNRFSGTAGQGVTMDDFSGDRIDPAEVGFIRGAGAQAAATTSTPIDGSGDIPPSVPQWGTEYVSWIHENANSVQSISSQIDTLPYEGNFVDLDPDVVDEDGIPVVRMTYSIHDNEKNAWDYIGGKLEEILTHLGATETWRAALRPAPHSIHKIGGARAGDDPAASVLNKHLLTHEIPNLAVLGGAAYASQSIYDPTLTMQAWAWLAADYMAKNFDEITAATAESSVEAVATPAD